MAGTQDPNDNPVGINVVPMVDVIFCLCVFFMCSMKFKELEGKFESWLPKNKGQSTPTNEVPLEEIRVAMWYDDTTKTLIRKFGNNTIRDDEHLKGLIHTAYEGYLRLNKPDTPCIIDAGEKVPWKEVIKVLNIAKEENIEKIEFAAGKNYDAPAAAKK